MTIGFGPSAPFDYYPDSMPIPDQFDIHALIELSQEIGVAVQTGTPVVPELESFEDHRVSLLEVQIASAVTKSFLNQLTTEAFAQCKHELAHLLESCKAILNPSQKLQFLRHVASEFLSENTSFSCEFASQPNLLPAGFALSWVANQPVTVTVTNPAARVLLRHRLLPTEYSDHYSAFIESLILGCALQFNPKERSELILTFGQLYTQFEYRFYPNQFLIHFFLSHILRVHDLYPQRDLCMYYRYNLIPTVYKQSDQRLAGDCTVKHLFLDNLVLSGDITKFARFSIKNDALAYKLLEYYVSQLITFGVTDSEIMLSNEIVLTLFTILSLFGGNIQERVLTNISRAYESITKKDPGLSLEIAKLFDVKQLCERHTISEIETSARQQISLLPFPSIIIRNLQIKMGIDLQRLPVSKPALPQNNIAWQEISQYLQSFATPSNHTIINQEKLHLTLLRGFLPCMIVAWKYAKRRFSPEALLDKFLTHFGACICIRFKQRFDDDLFGCAILGLLPLVDNDLLFKSEDFWNLSPIQSKEWVIAHIYHLTETLHLKTNKTYTIQVLLAGISKAQKWASSGPAGDAFRALLNDLNDNLHGDFSKQLRAFVPFIRSVGERDRKQHFAEILFYAYLAALFFIPAEIKAFPNEFIEAFFHFNKDRIQFCPDVAALEQAVATKDKNLLCVTKEGVHTALQAKFVATPALPIAGLVNKENTCFINASLQALLRVGAFQRLVHTDLGQNEPLQQMLRDQLENMQPQLAHAQIVDYLFKHTPDLQHMRGAFHDPTPVIEMILSCVKYDQKYQITYRGINEKRHLVSIRQNPLFVLQIPITGNRRWLQTLVRDAFLKKVVHDENNKWKADDNGREIAVSDYTIQHSLVEPLADLLVIQLERGYFNQADHETQASTVPVFYKDPVNIGSNQYTLRACINFLPEKNHYTADVYNNGHWYCCDDKSVVRISQPNTTLSYIYILEKTR